MTPNEIIKALECCADGSGTGLIRATLDLINRQREEIERLEREIEDLESTQEITPEAKYLVDTKADKVISLMNEIIKSQDQIKSEAIKEFAERLCEGRVSNDIVVIATQALLKEMTKENR